MIVRNIDIISRNFVLMLMTMSHFVRSEYFLPDVIDLMDVLVIKD